MRGVCLGVAVVANQRRLCGIASRRGNLSETERTEHASHPPGVGKSSVRSGVLRIEADSAIEVIDGAHPILFDEFP